MKKNILLLSLLAGFCKISAAVPPELLALGPANSEAGFFSDLPVVLSVSRLAQPTREAPGAVTVIDAEMIRQSGARELADILRLVPGFQVAQSTNGNGAPIAVYHGLTSNKAGSLQILIDGRSQYSGLWFGGINWSMLQVSLADIDRIEIVRGSNSAAFGANAVLGVVNIITIPAAQAHGMAAAVNVGNRGTRDVYARIGGGNEFGNYRLSVEQAQSGGLDYFPDDLRQQRFALHTDWRLSTQDEFEFIVGGVKASQQLGYPTLLEGTRWLGDEPAHDRDLSSYYAQATWRRQIAEGNELKVRFYATREETREKYTAKLDELINAKLPDPVFGNDLESDAELFFNYRPKADRYDFELQHTLPLVQDVRVVYGGGVRYDKISEPAFFATDDSFTPMLKRLFGNLEWRMDPALLLNFGFTAEKDSVAGSSLAPRLMFNWLASPTQTLRAGVSRAHRTPGLVEQKSNLRNDFYLMGEKTPFFSQEYLAIRQLSPEVLTAYEIGYLGEWKAQGVLADVRLFREEIRNRVVSYRPNPSDVGINDPYVLGSVSEVFANGQSVDIQGVEAQLRWSPIEGTRLWFNTSYLDLSSRLDAGLFDSQDTKAINNYTERSAPKNQSSLHWLQKLPGGFDSSLAWYRVNSYKWTRNTEAPAYTRVDWKLSYPFRHEGKQGELAFTWRAIGGAHAEYRYASESTYRYDKQLVDPSAFVSLRLGF